MSIIWFLSAIAFLLIRRYLGGYFSIFYSISAFTTCILSYLQNNFFIQFIFFLFFSLIVSPFIFKKIHFLHIFRPSRPLYFKELIGQPAIVTETIPYPSTSPGFIKLDNETWPAFSTTLQPLPKDSQVFVHKIDGLIVFVSPQKPPAK